MKSETRIYKVEMTENEVAEWNKVHPARKAEVAYTYNPEKSKEYREKAKAKAEADRIELMKLRFETAARMAKSIETK